MVDVYGGLWFENLVAQDAHFAFQCRLFERGFIRGIQLRVAHPCYTPDVSVVDLPRIAARLPDGMRVFVHFGAENCGVDFGRALDEYDVLRVRAGGRSWDDWNRETIAWGLAVAGAFPWPDRCPLGVAHPGYTFMEHAAVGATQCALALRALDDGTRIAVENVPPIVHADWYAAVTGTSPSWSRAHYWGVGGTPMGMRLLLAALGTSWRTLIDFTHLVVTCNQARNTWGPFVPYIPETYASIEHLVAVSLDLPHWPICHFSGVPPTLVDVSDHMDAPVCAPIRDALQHMDIVCLELVFRPWSAEHVIDDFRTRYLDARGSQ